jgi:hypothetical protein
MFPARWLPQLTLVGFDQMWATDQPMVQPTQVAVIDPTIRSDLIMEA